MSTKMASLSKTTDSGRAGTVDAAVLAHVKALGTVCRDAIVTSTELRVSTVCGAIDRLKKKNLIEEAPDKVLNTATGRNVKAYRAVNHNHTSYEA